jgi:cytochrome c-type biogenesis protein CcmH
MTIPPEPNLLTFWVGAGGILLIVLIRLLWISLRKPRELMRAASGIYQTQREALAQAAANGEVPPAHLASLEHELARATLEDAARESVAPHASSRTDRYGLSLLILVLLPTIAIPVYLKFGNPSPPNTPSQAAHPDPAEMVRELQSRIALAPNDPEPRLWLARVYMVSSQYDKAVKEFADLDKLTPEQPAVLLQYADALSMAHNGLIAGQAAELIQRALVLEPENVTGLWLAGLGADQAGESRKALDYLQKARQISATAEIPTTELDALIAEVETRTGLKAAPQIDAGPKVPPVPPTSPQIAVAVKVDPAVTAALPASTVVFVLAKAVSGPPMPLAVKRLTLGELPLTITLDDSLAMAPQFKLSSVKQVMVTARISRNGQPVAQKGDIEGTAGPLTVGVDNAVAITIDQRVP